MTMLRSATPPPPALPAAEHPIGFRKVELLRLFGFRIRLHIWHGNGSEAPHQHRWPFVGVPLWGRFVDTRWQVQEGVTHEPVLAWPSTAPGGRRYRRLLGAAVAVTPVGVRVRYPLLPYRCRLGDIHSAAAVGAGRHVSLVLLGPARSSVSTLWIEREAS